MKYDFWWPVILTDFEFLTSWLAKLSSRTVFTRITTTTTSATLIRKFILAQQWRHRVNVNEIRQCYRKSKADYSEMKTAVSSSSSSSYSFIICPIAIAYSMGQIIKSVCVCACVCVSVCLSVCEHSHGRTSWSIFTKIGTDVRTPKSKNEFVGG